MEFVSNINQPSMGDPSSIGDPPHTMLICAGDGRWMKMLWCSAKFSSFVGGFSVVLNITFVLVSDNAAHAACREAAWPCAPGCMFALCVYTMFCLVRVQHINVGFQSLWKILFVGGVLDWPARIFQVFWEYLKNVHIGGFLKWGYLQSSILIGFSLRSHLFWGIHGYTHLWKPLYWP